MLLERAQLTAGTTWHAAGLVEAAGFNSLGILLGGGAGKVMAQWIVDGVPDVDVTEIDIARMLPFQNTPKYLKDRTVEVLGFMFEEGYPNRQFETARNVRKSAFHDRLAEAGAYFGTYAGWEYPDWFAPQGVWPKVEYSWGRQNWFDYSAEHRATREGVTMLDYSVMAKILVQGRDQHSGSCMVEAEHPVRCARPSNEYNFGV